MVNCLLSKFSFGVFFSPKVCGKVDVFLAMMKESFRTFFFFCSPPIYGILDQNNILKGKKIRTEKHFQHY